jgi:DNA-binding protein H-NS
MNPIVYTTESTRPELQRRCGERVKFYGQLDALDAERVPPTACLLNVREIETNQQLADHCWLQVRAKDWARWEALYIGTVVSATGKVARYGKPGRPGYSIEECVLTEAPTVYRDGKKEPVVVVSQPPSAEANAMTPNLNEIIEGFKQLNLQDLEVVQIRLNEEVARQKELALEVLHAEMKERAMKAGVSLADLFERWAHLAPAPAAEIQKAAKVRLPPKFANPADPTQTWSGLGRQPPWLKEKLKAGHAKSEFLISVNGAAV